MANNLEAQKLSYHPSSAKSPILTEVSYNFEEGHMTALLGPNGSGKTTMLRHFLAQIKSTAGAALIGEKDALTYAPKGVAGRSLGCRRTAAGRVLLT